MNPYALLAGGILLVAMLAGSFTAGWKTNGWRIKSQEAAIEEAAVKAGQAATDAAVTAIQGLRPKFTTIKQDTIRETHIEPRYLAGDCSHTDPVWMQLRAGYEAAGGSLGSGTVVQPAPVSSGSHDGSVNVSPP